MEFKRARSDEQKTVRIRQIVDATLELLETQTFDKITFKAIADKLDFSRINMYKYVTTKEEVFLLVMTQDMEAWVSDIEAEFTEKEPCTTDEFLRSWASALYKHKRLLQWFTLLSIIIEQNVSLESLVAFKKRFYELYGKVYPIAEKMLPNLNKEGVRRFLWFQMQYAMGLFNTTETTEIQRKAMKICGLESNDTDFIEEYVQITKHVIDGMSNITGEMNIHH